MHFFRYNKSLLLLCLLLTWGGIKLSMAQTPSLQRVMVTQGFKLNPDQAAARRSFAAQRLALPIINAEGQEKVFETTDFTLRSPNPEVDPYGYQHYHYVQTINGIEVDGAEVKVHVKNGTVQDHTGHWLLEVSPALKQLKPTQTLNQVLATVEKSLAGKQLLSHDLVSPGEALEKSGPLGVPDDAKLVYVPISRDFENLSSDSVRLAYRFTVRTSGMGKYMYYIDATNGALLYKVDMVCRIMGHRQHEHSSACIQHEPQATPLAPVAPPLTETPDRSSILSTVYSGRATSVTTTKRSDGQWALKDLDRNIEVFKVNDDDTDFANPIPFLNNSNTWRIKAPVPLDAYAVDAYWGAQQTYDFFNTTLKDWSYKSGHLGNKLEILTNLIFFVEDTSGINAYYDGERLLIGRGAPKQGITPLSTLDIMAHEVTHGITAGTSGLQYLNESGAINEAISDIFGTAVEHYKRPWRKDWTLGEDMGLIVRSMSNPNAYGQPRSYGGKYFFNYAVEKEKYVDNGGVHINSGIMNYWFHILCTGGNIRNELGKSYNITKIDMEDLLKIVHYAQRYYLTPGTNFIGVRQATQQAANTIFGVSSPQAKVLSTAWDAVNVMAKSIQCVDKNEPNNDRKTATLLKTNLPTNGNFADFATSKFNIYNTDEYHTIPDNEVVKFNDWYTFSTTPEEPYFMIEIEIANGEKIYAELRSYDEVNGNTQIFQAVNELNSLNKTLRLYPKGEDSDIRRFRKWSFVVMPGHDGIYNKCMEKNSDGCYTVTVKTSTSPFIDPNDYFRLNSFLNVPLILKWYYTEGRRKGIMSLQNDRQIESGADILYRDFDEGGDQLWEFVRPKSTSHTVIVKNLNCDKVMELTPEGTVVLADWNPQKTSQQFNIELTAFGISISSPTYQQPLILDDLSKKIKISKKNPYYTYNGWVPYTLTLPSTGNYLLRSSTGKQVLERTGQGITLSDYDERSEQIWTLTEYQGGRYNITSVVDGHALNLSNSNKAENASYNVQIANKNGMSQSFKILPAGKEGEYKIVSSVSQKGLTRYTDRSVKQNTYAGFNNQKWYLEPVQTIHKGYYYLQNRATGLYMDVASGYREDGDKLIIHPFRAGTNQLFYVEPQADGTFILEAVHSKKALSTNSTLDNFNLYQWTTDRGKINHKWKISYTYDGYFKVISAFSGKAVQAGVSPSEARIYAPLVQSAYKINNFYQHWKFQPLGSPIDDSVQRLAGDLTRTEDVPEQESPTEMQVYPNPAKDQLTVAYALEQGESAVIKLYDLLGREVSTQTTLTQYTQINLAPISAGVYMVQLKSSTGKKQSRKLVVNK